jgi:hypothetical protein
MSTANTTPTLSDRAKAEARRILDRAARRRLGERLEQAKTPTTTTYKRPLSRTAP